ncbi:MAG TPA: thiol reductase thioredoxin, partial [Rhodocyclaceae bacterium]|nr:thiol reductase thioredoxin [Rhodocyclaceae bacterium]
MSDALHLVCPHCDAVNRVPATRLAEAPNCGRCGK